VDETLKKYRKQLVKEGVIKASLLALIFAFLALGISTTIFWFVDYKSVWLGVVIFVVVYLAVATALYFLKYRPDQKMVARRVDSEFQLDERMLTMTEFAGKNSVMLNAQRAETTSKLSSLGNKKLAIVATSLVTIICLSAGFVFGAGMTTVSALSAADVIPSGKELIDTANAEPPKYYTITYRIEGEVAKDTEDYVEGELDGVGKIYGETTQTILEGENATSVWALPVKLSGYYFVSWSDGYSRPYRSDKNITEDLTLVAKFELIKEDEDQIETDASPNIPLPEGSGDGSSSENPVLNEDLPQDENESDSNGDGLGSGSGGSYAPTSQVIDGETYYGGTTYENFYDEAMEEMGDEDIPEDIEDIIKGYYTIIKK
jgi:hypothetical protein